ncbi:MAG: hypothetical protein AB1938_27400 [Myxococcota bacterium]
MRNLMASFTAVFWLGCTLPFAMPPATSVSRFVDARWPQGDSQPHGRVTATGTSLFFNVVGTDSNQGAISGYQVFTPEASVRVDLGRRYQLAPTFSGTLLGVDAQLVVLRGRLGALGVLHGAGFGVNRSAGLASTSSGGLTVSFHGGLLGQVPLGVGTIFLSGRYAYGTGVPFGSSAPGYQYSGITPMHFISGNLGFALPLGSVVCLTPEFAVTWATPAGDLPGSSTLPGASGLIIAPAISVGADF